MVNRGFLVFLGVAGAAVLAGAATTTIIRGVTFQDVLLLSLTVPAAWLRIKLEPSGYITLAPVVVVTSVALAPPHIPVLVASLAAVTSSGLFARRQALDTFADAGEEVIPILLALTVFDQPASQLGSIGTAEWTARFALGIGAYVLARVTLAILRAKVSERIGTRSFLKGAGKAMTTNFLFLSLVALGLSLLTNRYGSTGYFALTLSIITLVESYHPHKLLSDQTDTLFASLSMIAQAIDLKDAYTGRHARDASKVAVRIARTLRLPESEVRKIRIAGILHDIGKVGVDGRIIRKPSALEPSEMSAMRQHPIIGAGIMQPVDLLADASEIVLHHHEHYDGSGYPGGLVGEDIPIGSRIVLVADAFNAITTDRPYRKARSKSEALRILREQSGKQFDPKVVAATESIAAVL